MKTERLPLAASPSAATRTTRQGRPLLFIHTTTQPQYPCPQRNPMRNHGGGALSRGGFLASHACHHNTAWRAEGGLSAVGRRTIGRTGGSLTLPSGGATSAAAASADARVVTERRAATACCARRCVIVAARLRLAELRDAMRTAAARAGVAPCARSALLVRCRCAGAALHAAATEVRATVAITGVSRFGETNQLASTCEIKWGARAAGVIW